MARPQDAIGFTNTQGVSGAVDAESLGLLLAFHASPWAFVSAAVAAGLPGIAGQVVLIPLLMRRLGSQVAVAA